MELQEYASFFNVAKYLTVRTIISLLFSLTLSLLLYPWFIRAVTKKQIGQVIRENGPKSHYSKSGTPTMGGLLLVVSIVATCLLWMRWDNQSLWLCLFLLGSYSFLGFKDDYEKISKGNSKGLSAKQKLFWQITIAALVCYYNYFYLQDPETAGLLTIPYTKSLSIDLGIFYIPFSILVIVGTSNAVNLTDGLDGLAIGPVMIAAACYGVINYASGHLEFANYLKFPFLPYSGELAIVSAAIIGTGLGFLWYNTYPAQIFMGDLGSLALGGLLGFFAVLSKQELLLLIIGGVFVIEAVSVITQVASFKLSGKRIFKMAPIHHHFELKGWAEPKIIVRFWIISIVLSLVGLLSLKIK